MNLLNFSILLIIGSTLLPQYVDSLKCYVCEYNAVFCKGINCYNNPDICSTNQFSTALVPVAECPRNCQLKAVSNPAGLIVKWSRFCAPANDLSKGFKCRTDFKIGTRIDQCICDKDYCNHSIAHRISNFLICFHLLFIYIMYKY